MLYGELTPWYRLLDPPEDHEEETTAYREKLARAVNGPLATLLELGAGAGHNGVHLKAHLSCTLTDLSPEMLALSRELNPDCEHVLGDLRSLRLGRTFDAVLVHDAICYMTSRTDLEAALATAFAHVRPGGAALFLPDHIRDTFAEHTSLEGNGDLKGVMWTWDPDPDDELYAVDFALLIRDQGKMRAIHDQHVEGLFTRATWLELLARVGFEVVEASDDPSFLCRHPP